MKNTCRTKKSTYLCTPLTTVDGFKIDRITVKPRLKRKKLFVEGFQVLVEKMKKTFTNTCLNEISDYLCPPKSNEMWDNKTNEM